MIKIWPYKLGSSSAKALAEELGCLRVRSRGHYRPRADHLIINWGNGQRPIWDGRPHVMLNDPFAVARASDKLMCLGSLTQAEIEVPLYTSTHSVAHEWCDNGHTIFCRTLTRANSGRGIVIANSPGEIVPAPLYTVDVGKRREYRVHVFNGEVIDFSMKRKLTSEELDARGIVYNRDIRSHGNGWIFARDGVDLPDQVRTVAVDAINALSLDFGAVDCYFTSRDNPSPQVAGVFEVNTAPGIEGTTLARYAEVIRRIAGESEAGTSIRKMVGSESE